MTTIEVHREAMRSALRRGGALAEAWCEAHAAGADTGPIDVAIADAVRDYRRAERHHRKATRRAEILAEAAA